MFSRGDGSLAPVRDRPPVTVALVVSTPIQVIRVMHAVPRMSAVPAVSTHGDSYRTVVSESGRAEPLSLRVDRLVNVTRSESTVPHG